MARIGPDSVRAVRYPCSTNRPHPLPCNTTKQEKRQQFLALLQQLLAAKEEQATQRVWLQSERERAEEARGQLLDARLRALQHGRRIKELLLRTDPQLSPGDLKGAFWGGWLWVWVW